MRICCWQPVLTAHQSHTLRGLADAAQASLRVIACAPDIAVRRDQGWTTDAASVVPVEILPDHDWQARIRAILREERDSIHIFGSPFERSRQNVALGLALWHKLETYLISEPYSPVATGYLADAPRWKERVKTFLRPRLYGLYGQLLRGRLSGVFAISPAGVRQYRRMGIATDRIFPFGYFVPLDPAPQARPMASGGLKVAYLGSFIERKGVDSLVAAFDRPELVACGATLTLYGGAPAAGTALEGERVRYGGRLPFGAVGAALAGHDLLVVPSLYDGWAVVVNEAIGAGVPVLASDMVGAAAMVAQNGCGDTFPPGDAGALARSIAKIAADPARLQGWRDRTSPLADLLQPIVAGAYMRDCIAATHAGTAPPPAPWYTA
ncbi:hypothetical protein JAGODDHD_03781 (plasmid) [Sphingomonas paucimobilis]|uniref:glycosyltransferase n=1 Tax=Sphingomonas TaxID=13687 RepID=UPI00243524F2|nr:MULTISPECIES: glycosyltransferase [Sphingomonas]MDG5973011.1 hypothetical protein [Sphingomonas paucimobilis]MDR6116802.1 glycosyltransferase involved in cell wall biosynthesis [Sphingomonas sp. SORGH_AS_0789]MDR6151859.1 glycosyltransferase involved in cell wall biosynthesis [Sphingomonas sp. SORGH_AS_0742]